MMITEYRLFDISFKWRPFLYGERWGWSGSIFNLVPSALHFIVERKALGTRLGVFVFAGASISSNKVKYQESRILGANIFLKELKTKY